MATSELEIQLISGVLQSAEVEQRALVDASEAGIIVDLRAGQVPSAGSGDTLEPDTRELYISPGRSRRPANSNDTPWTFAWIERNRSALRRPRSGNVSDFPRVVIASGAFLQPRGIVQRSSPPIPCCETTANFRYVQN